MLEKVLEKALDSSSNSCNIQSIGVAPQCLRPHRWSMQCSVPWLHRCAVCLSVRSHLEPQQGQIALQPLIKAQTWQSPKPAGEPRYEGVSSHGSPVITIVTFSPFRHPKPGLSLLKLQCSLQLLSHPIFHRLLCWRFSHGEHIWNPTEAQKKSVNCSEGVL